MELLFFSDNVDANGVGIDDEDAPERMDVASTSAKGVRWMFCVRAHISANNSANITAFNNVCKSLTL